MKIFSTRVETLRSSRLRRLAMTFGVLLVVLLVAAGGIWRFYHENLKPVSKDARATTIIIKSGATPRSIAGQLHDEGIIRNAWTFERYVQSKNVSEYLQAGTYSLSPSQSVADIVSQLTHGKVSTKLVTILPGQRLDQIRQTLINDGFSKAQVDAALQASMYEDNAALVDKPTGNSLEGYLYPDSFQRTAETDPSVIVKESIAEMQQNLTPEIRSSIAAQGLSVYQGIILASIIEREASSPDRPQVAQVFLTRLKMGMALQSDATASYGAILAGRPAANDGRYASYDSPYNTYLHAGLPPTPISNVSKTALQAVAQPALTDWLYFVADDNGGTHFSRTLQEHEALAQQYCHKACGR